MKRYLLPLFLLVGSLFSLPASSILLTSEVSGSSTPTPISSATNDFLINGDFLITQDPSSCCSVLLGDGNNDDTEWVFDFGPDSVLLSGKTLASALLTLTLETTAGVTTDTIEIVGLGARAASEIRSLTGGFDGSITFDLLPYYSSIDILENLFDPQSGAIGMIYEDDAIVSYARLELRSIPEPTSLVLMGLGLAGIGYRRHCCKKAA